MATSYSLLLLLLVIKLILKREGDWIGGLKFTYRMKNMINKLLS